MAKGTRYKEDAPKQKKKLASGWKIAISVLSVILALVIAAIAVFFYYFGGLKTTYLTNDTSQLGIDSQVIADTSDKDITNIALFGVDSRDHDDTGRSDALMIMSVDKMHGKIKLPMRMHTVVLKCRLKPSIKILIPILKSMLQ